MTGKAAIIGGGVIGGGWAARFLLNGWTVAIFDPDPDAARKIDAVLINARTSMPSLYDRPLPPEGALTYAASLDDAVSGADWVQESTPERLDMKRGVLAQITAAAPETAIVASSTSGFKPSDLNAEGGRSIVAHPFNPVYLLPLVELVGASETCARAADILEGLGMFPLTLRQEVDAHIADRLLEAVWRESLWLVHDASPPRNRSTRRSAWASASAGRRWDCSRRTGLRAVRRAWRISWRSSGLPWPGPGPN